MKKLRLLNFILFWLFAGILFSGCSDDEDPGPTIIGYWELQTQEVRNANQQINGVYNSLFGLEIPNSGGAVLSMQSQQLEFFPTDNSFVNTLNTAFGVTFVESGTWSLEDDNSTLILSYSSEDFEYTIDLEMNQMFLTTEEVFSYDDDDDDSTPPVPVTGDVTYRYIKLY